MTFQWRDRKNAKFVCGWSGGPWGRQEPNDAWARAEWRRLWPVLCQAEGRLRDLKRRKRRGYDGTR
jgi:hypothetical protein